MANFADLIKDGIAPFIANVGLLSILAWILFIYGQKIFLVPLNDSKKIPILLGFVFGMASTIAMFLPIELSQGVFTDARGVPVIFAGLIGGPVSAVIAAAISVLTRYSIGGPGWLAGACLIVGHGVTGLIARYLSRDSKVIPSIWALVVIAFFAAASSIPGILFLPGEFQFGVLTQLVPLLLLANIIGCLILGSLMSMVEKRYLLVRALAETRKDVERTNDQLGKSEARFRTIFEQAAVGVAIIESHTGAFIQVNKRYCEIIGYTLEEMLHTEFQKITHPSDLQEDLDNMKRLLAGAISEFSMEKRYFHKDESIVWVNLTVSPTWAPGKQPVYHIAIVEDITDRKKIEGQLRQSQKMEAVGQLTGGIAHDFNNMLGIVLGNLELLRGRVADDPKALVLVENAYRGGRRGADITRKLLSFSRQSISTPEIINPNVFIRGMEELIAKALTPKVSVKTHLEDNIWSVNIDPNELEDALLNICLNAGDAMKSRGDLIIETINKNIDNSNVQTNPEFTPGEYVRISVSDTGSGMTPEVQAQAFEPFYTTKDKSKGTGLGLSMVYGFVMQSDGHIKIYSEPDRGTTVCLYLPRVMESSVTTSLVNEDVCPELPCGDETILIVDDEKELLDVANSYLHGLGYKTMTASDGHQALQTLQENNHIDLVFSDILMPGGISGFDLAKKTKELHPNIKVLLTSGFASEPEEILNNNHPLFEELFKNRLNKPYAEQDLAVAIRRILDKDTG